MLPFDRPLLEPGSFGIGGNNKTGIFRCQSWLSAEHLTILAVENCHTCLAVMQGNPVASLTARLVKLS